MKFVKKANKLAQWDRILGFEDFAKGSEIILQKFGDQRNVELDRSLL